MAYAPITGTGTGVAPVVNLTWPFIKQADVAATVNGSPVAITWTGAAQVTLPVVANGQAWSVYRYTSIESPAVSYTNGAVLANTDLNTEVQQLQFSLQEARNAGLGGDVSLRTQLASTGGAALVGLAGGGFVSDAAFQKGNPTAVAGVSAKIAWVRDDAAFPLANEGGIWPGVVAIGHGFNSTFVAGDAATGNPAFGVFALANNNGAAGEVVAVGGAAVARVNGSTVFGGNLIAQGSGKDSCKYIGLEIDIEPTLADTNISNTSIGLALNVFNRPIPGAAIQIGAASGGSFANGILLGGLATTAAGLALPSLGTADSLINTTAGTFTTAAVLLGAGPTRGLKFSGNGASIYYDGVNHRMTLPSGGILILRDSADTNSLIGYDSGGNVQLQTGTIQWPSAMSTASATAGTSGALPAQAAGYITVTVNGTNRKIPYFAV